MAAVVSTTVVQTTADYTVTKVVYADGSSDLQYAFNAGTATANQAALQQKAQAALNANATFLALASPSNVQTVAQVQLLTKECNALIRLLLGLLDTTVGT